MDAVVVGVVLGADVFLAAQMVTSTLTSWLHGDRGGVGWLGWYNLRDPGELSGWLVAAIAAIVCTDAVARGWGRHPWFRIVGALQMLLCVGTLAWTLVTWPTWYEVGIVGTDEAARVHVPWTPVLALVAGVACGLSLAARWVEEGKLAGRTRAILLTATLIVVVSGGWPTLRNVWEEHQTQAFPPFTLVLTTARRIHPTEVLNADVEVVGYEGVNYRLDRESSMHLTEAHVKRVRFRTFSDLQGAKVGVSIRLAEDLRPKLEQRSRHHLHENLSEAVWLNGGLITVARYDAVIYDGVFLLLDRPDSGHASHELFEAITQRSP